MKTISSVMKVLVFTFAVLALAFLIIRWGLKNPGSHYIADVPAVYEVQSGYTKTTIASAAPTPTKSPTQSTALLKVAFTSQAPFANWDALHEDACEEASFFMVKHYMDGSSLGSKEEVDAEITDLVHWEESKGYGTSITLEELNTIASEHFNVSGGVVQKNIAITDIKREVLAGHPVILGMAGKMLDNPNFKGGGPIYHMLVVIGYNPSGFITNDPGTRLGEKFHYDYDGFMNAIHDWNPTDISAGGRDMLVFK